jgi:hypothetical protein
LTCATGLVSAADSNGKIDERIDLVDGLQVLQLVGLLGGHRRS